MAKVIPIKKPTWRLVKVTQGEASAFRILSFDYPPLHLGMPNEPQWICVSEFASDQEDQARAKFKDYTTPPPPIVEELLLEA